MKKSLPLSFSSIKEIGDKLKQNKKNIDSSKNNAKENINTDLELFFDEIKRLEGFAVNKNEKYSGFKHFENLNKSFNFEEKNKQKQNNIDITQKNALKPPIKREKSDSELFFNEMEGIKKLAGPEKLREIPANKKIKREIFHDYSNNVEILETPEDYYNYSPDPFSLEHSSEYIEWTAPSVDIRIAKRLHKGEFSVQEYLDLHGYTVDDALKLCYEFFSKAISEGKKCVAVIHGRGLSSEKGPVIKDAFIKWLKRGPFRRYTLAFATAPRTDGGFGVTYILLKRNKLKRKVFLENK
jgi:DNA-nicking Smr family endonuclease